MKPAPNFKDDDLSAQLSVETIPAYLQYAEAKGAGNLDPLSDEALRLQSEYIAQVGDHPLDVLKTLARNPFVKPSERIAAAKALLEYGMRKVPAQLELKTQGAGLSVDVSLLSGLNDKELDLLEKLLAKAQKAAS